MHAVGKMFGKICLKAIRDIFFRICGMWSGEGRGDSRSWLVWYPTEGDSSNFWACKENPRPQLSSLVEHPNLPIRKTLITVLGLLTVIILKRVSESIFFQSNKFTACKVKDEKEVTNYLMVFNLLSIIHPFQGNKHLRTKWNLNCNPQEYLIGY